MQKLSELSRVSGSTIKRIELDDGIPSATPANIAALQTALEVAGIEFIGTPDDGPGIRLHRR